MRIKVKSIHVMISLVILMSFQVSKENGICQHVQQPHWDADGGHDADYSGIPWLEWMGPEEPGSFEDYLQQRKQRPFQTECVSSGLSAGGGDRSGKALVLVNSTLFDGIQVSLLAYIMQLQADGYTVEVHKTTGGTPKDLKAFLLARSNDLVGCVLVGDHPAAWYEYYDGSNKHIQFPCDLYYMDLDGLWIDIDSNGVWDDLQAGSGDEGPEIFIGRIDASMMLGDETDLTNAYFAKNLAYRTGAIHAPAHALTYTEDDWVYFQDIRTDIKHAYTYFDEICAPATDRNDYLDHRIPNPDYEFIQLACHSSSMAHHFNRGGQAMNIDIKAAVPHAMFYNLFACGSLRWTDMNYLGGCYIYNSSETALAVIGSAKSGSMLEFHAFYMPFGAYTTFGEAFRQWFNYLAPFTNHEIVWHFGMTIAGDPFLKKLKHPLHIKFPNGLPQGCLPPGPETSIALKIIDGLESYVPGSGLLHYRFDSSEPFMMTSLIHRDGGLNGALIPNTRPGDKPEFYFSVTGDRGTVVTSPHDAPDTVYSFELGLEVPVWEDDFETDKGWTVQNWLVQCGGWERGDPSGTPVQPEDDHSFLGTQCFVTGKAGGYASDNDLDGGPTRLISPAFDLSSGDGIMKFYVWFHHTSYGAYTPLEVRLSDNNGLSWVKVDSINNDPGWHLKSYKVSDFVMPSSQVKIMISAQDNPDSNIVEALIDDFTLLRLESAPSLWADAYSMDAQTGGVVDLHLDAGQTQGNRPYLILGSFSGTTPGTALPDGKVLPLNWDLLTDMIMVYANTPFYMNFTGNLDSTGCAAATLNDHGRMDPSLVGMTLYFAFMLFPEPYFVSNPIAIALES